MLNKFTCHSMILSFVRRRIRLTDACLLLFMIILMMQSVYNLFFRELNGLEGAGAIDVIIRTTTAAIYGYFIGAGFLRDEQILEQEGKIDAPMTKIRDAEINQALSIQANYIKQRARQQIIIVATIGIFSLIILLVVNNVVIELPTTAIATVSQLRDFVSGSVGLLIGNSKQVKR